MLRNFKIPLTVMLVVLFASLGLTANAQKDDDKTYIKTTEKGTYYQLVGWKDMVVYNPYTFTWYTWEKPVIKEKTVEMTHMVPVSEFDRPPVFDGSCLMKEDKLACSNNEMQEFFDNHYIEYPEEAQKYGEEGLEYVSFTIDTEGNLEGNLEVTSKDNSCTGCEEAAADLVAMMEDKWFPAIKDGKPVETHLTVPVRFILRQ
ncbi:MAG TPA: energy transducer TonB [Flavilitoribacter sp.]|nr:energy transducer TonB [Flavilitoribacter sp.]HMQ88234.1 energy transducer TonB [Flavilitoribacter sp.]